jgi:FdhD protein
VAAEDVGRHNAIDKVLGRVALDGHWPPPPVLMTTSRGSFDVVQKAVVAGVQILALASGPSALAVQVALAAGVTLVGFLRPPRMVVYTHRSRILP